MTLQLWERSYRFFFSLLLPCSGAVLESVVSRRTSRCQTAKPERGCPPHSLPARVTVVGTRWHSHLRKDDTATLGKVLPFFFLLQNSLASAVSKTITLNKDVLAQVVEKTYRSWHTAKRLDKLWRLKSAVLREIISATLGKVLPFFFFFFSRSQACSGRVIRSRPRHPLPSFVVGHP